MNILDPDIVTAEQAANLLNLKLDTLSRWRTRGCGPKFYKIGRRIYYRKSDLVAFINAQARTITECA